VFVFFNSKNSETMKREILFRGLRTDGKGWAYGYLVETEYGIDNGHEMLVCYQSWICDREFIQIEVNPSTVGQFTGVTDCDDRKVFEGDIIDYNLNGFLLIVEFIGGCFVLSGPDYPKPMRGTTTQGRVIRNIHEQ
jgi:hypothetical protein